MNINIRNGQFTRGRQQRKRVQALRQYKRAAAIIKDP